MAGRAGSGRRPGDVYPVLEWLCRRCRRWVEQSASLWTCRWWLGAVLEQPEAASGGGVGCSWGGGEVAATERLSGLDHRGQVFLGAVVGVFVLQQQFGGRFHLAGAGAAQGRDLVGPFPAARLSRIGDLPGCAGAAPLGAGLPPCVSGRRGSGHPWRAICAETPVSRLIPAHEAPASRATCAEAANSRRACSTLRLPATPRPVPRPARYGLARRPGPGPGRLGPDRSRPRSKDAAGAYPGPADSTLGPRPVHANIRDTRGRRDRCTPRTRRPPHRTCAADRTPQPCRPRPYRRSDHPHRTSIRRCRHRRDGTTEPSCRPEPTCCMAGSGAWLIGARAVQGVGAAVLAPVTLAIVAAAFAAGAARTRALAVWTALGWPAAPREICGGVC